jgi:hypothetical protein
LKYLRLDGSSAILLNRPAHPNSNGHGLSLARIEHNGEVVRDVIWAGPGNHVTGVRVVLAYNERQQ